jgi:hypothetical protein
MRRICSARCIRYSAINPQPSTLNPQPTCNPQPTSFTKSSTINPQPSTLNRRAQHKHPHPHAAAPPAMDGGRGSGQEGFKAGDDGVARSGAAFFGGQGGSMGVGGGGGGRRQNLSNMYQDEGAARERDRRKAEYARDLQVKSCKNVRVCVCVCVCVCVLCVTPHTRA